MPRSVSGASSVNAESLRAENADVDASGASSVNVFAASRLRLAQQSQPEFAHQQPGEVAQDRVAVVQRCRNDFSSLRILQKSQPGGTLIYSSVGELAQRTIPPLRVIRDSFKSQHSCCPRGYEEGV